MPEYLGDHPDDESGHLAHVTLDSGVISASPSSAYRISRKDSLLEKADIKFIKGQKIHTTDETHQQWYIDVSYLSICRTFYYLCSILNGYSRHIAHWEIRESMTEADVETVLRRALEALPDARPRIISDNAPRAVAQDFKASSACRG